MDAEDEVDSNGLESSEPLGSTGSAANYEIAVIERSRRNWEVIDGWAKASGVERPQCLLHDGQRLRNYWRKLAGRSDLAVAVAGRLAADEMDLRLKELK